MKWSCQPRQDTTCGNACWRLPVSRLQSLPYPPHGDIFIHQKIVISPLGFGKGSGELEGESIILGILKPPLRHTMADFKMH